VDGSPGLVALIRSSSVGSVLKSAIEWETISCPIPTVRVSLVKARIRAPIPPPRQFYSLIMDEIWRTLQVSSGMVDRIQALPRSHRRRRPRAHRRALHSGAGRLLVGLPPHLPQTGPLRGSPESASGAPPPPASTPCWGMASSAICTPKTTGISTQKPMARPHHLTYLFLFGVIAAVEPVLLVAYGGTTSLPVLALWGLAIGFCIEMPVVFGVLSALESMSQQVVLAGGLGRIAVVSPRGGSASSYRRRRLPRRR